MNAITVPQNQTQLYDVGVFNASVPPEGPKACPITLPFSQATTVNLNLLLTQASASQRQVQCIFFDNSKNSAEVAITTSVLNQTLRLPPNTMGYVPLLVPKNAALTAFSEGAVDVPIILLNIPVPACIWEVPQDGNSGATSAPAGATTILGTDGGAVGDFLDWLLVVPASTSPGAVQIEDGAAGAITVFAGGAASLTSLVPFVIPLGISSRAGPWSVIAGADANVLAFGQFT